MIMVNVAEGKKKGGNLSCGDKIRPYLSGKKEGLSSSFSNADAHGEEKRKRGGRGENIEIGKKRF